jgi:hypothetical protein
MTEQEPIKMKVSEMVRTTANNTGNMMMQIADHIDKLEAEIIRLTAIVEGMESDPNTN